MQVVRYVIILMFCISSYVIAQDNSDRNEITEDADFTDQDELVADVFDAEPVVIQGTPEVENTPEYDQTDQEASVQTDVTSDQDEQSLAEPEGQQGDQDQDQPDDTQPVDSGDQSMQSADNQILDTSLEDRVRDTVRQEEGDPNSLPDVQQSVSAQIPTLQNLPREDEPDEDDVELVGFDTDAIEGDLRGNWLFKRVWFEKAQKVYEKIKERVTHVFDSRLSFFEKRTQLDRFLFDPFYLEIGISQGELSEIVQYFIEQLERDKEKEGSLTENERAFAIRLTEEKTALEQLRVDIDAVAKLDQAINDAITELLNQMNRARGFERQAWDAFKAITQELNDKKARDYYYTMRNMLQNCQSVLEYITDPFTHYFNQIIAQAQEKVESIKQQIGTLKQKGIDLKAEAQRLQEEPLVDPAPKQEQAEKDENLTVPAVEPRGFFGSLIDMIGSFFSSIGSGVMSLFDGLLRWIGLKSTVVYDDHINNMIDEAVPDDPEQAEYGPEVQRKERAESASE